MKQQFERYVNFEFYETVLPTCDNALLFERYVNFEFYETGSDIIDSRFMFERYVNFEFYETKNRKSSNSWCLRDM